MRSDAPGSIVPPRGGRRAIWKEIGETPLEALERLRASLAAESGSGSFDAPMTYAGRLDPMAEGELLVLWGDECKDKERYLGLDKEYEVEVVFGIETDTYDALGMAAAAPGGPRVLERDMFQSAEALARYAGKIRQEYPPYSSKTVDGRQLHELARAGELPEELPAKEIEIYSIELLSTGEIRAAELKGRMFGMIDRVKGDFRQTEIKERWSDILGNDRGPFPAIRIRVRCSSGTYMRSLAQRMGKDAGTGAFALAIRRTRILLPK